MIYKLILTLRDLHYRRGKHSSKAVVPTVSIGNITAGGTGKTPHVELTIRRLLTLGRSDIAVLSLGYGRRTKGFRYVQTDSTPEECGDEPLQIKRKFPVLPVAVAKDRLDGCRRLANPDPDAVQAGVVILDDAMQYRRLTPHLSVVLTLFNRPVTKDSLLPGGRLRDLKKRLYETDAVIVTKCPYELDGQEKAGHAALLGFDSYDPATCTAVRKGVARPLLFSRIVHGAPEPLFPEADKRYTYSGKAVLFSGIADDTPLRDHISSDHKIVAHKRFPDHHRYGRGDIRFLCRLMRGYPTAVFVTTEKDAQRLRPLSGIPAGLRARMFYVPIQASFLTPEEEAVFDNQLQTI